MPDDVVDAAALEARRQLVALAFRLLGTSAEAEDAVQEAYVRWYRMTPAERAAIERPGAWLTRVTGRVCLDVLSSARVRRETYVGPWLPEPVPAGSFAVTAASDARPVDPLDQVVRDETVSSALLVVMETMTPAERVAFVLHDVFAVPYAEVAQTVGRSEVACRQLASSARRRIQSERRRRAPAGEHAEVVRGFALAAASGDLTALLGVLDPQVELRSDGGGVVSAARRPVVGPEPVARLLLGLMAKRPHAEVAEQWTADGLGFVVREHGSVTGVVTVGVHDGQVADVRIVLNPRKLTLWE